MDTDITVHKAWLSFFAGGTGVSPVQQRYPIFVRHRREKWCDVYRGRGTNDVHEAKG